MKNLDLLARISDIEKGDKPFVLSYSSLIEEALKIALRSKDNNEPLIVVKENNYMANRLKDILVSYFDEDEIISYLPEESLRE